jgi:hypothetical protein
METIFYFLGIIFLAGSCKKKMLNRRFGCDKRKRTEMLEDAATEMGIDIQLLKLRNKKDTYQ